MQPTLLAADLGFPEGPAVMADGRIVLCDGNTGELLVYHHGKVSSFAHIGGCGLHQSRPAPAWVS